MTIEDFLLKLRRFGLFWLAGVLAVTTLLAFFGLSIFVPSFLALSSVQLSLALGIVATFTSCAVGLHMSGLFGKDALDRITLALAVSAIVFAIWQFRDARAAESTMSAISQQLTTRFVGIFPKNLEEINDNIKHTDYFLDIMVDFVGYGHYSAPEEFDTYFRKLEDLRSVNKIPIRMLIYTRKKGGDVHDSQFKEAQFKEAYRTRDKKLVAFAEKWNKGQIPASKPEFDELLFRKQRDYIKELSERGVLIRATDDDLPFYLWNLDDQVAVFSFLNEDIPGAREVSFWTRDRSLVVDTFKVRFCKLWNTAGNIEITDSGWKAKPYNSAEQDPSNCNPLNAK